MASGHDATATTDHGPKRISLRYRPEGKENGESNKSHDERANGEQIHLSTSGLAWTAVNGSAILKPGGPRVNPKNPLAK